MSNTVITISYDGTAYSGFQIQANANTVQAELERALAVIYKEPVRINGAGRTDAGVHALGQVANFTAPFTIETDKLPHALNCLLPDDVVVTAAHEAGDGFHARFDAVGKVYSYSIDRALHPQVLRRLYSWYMPEPLNLDQLRAAAGLFEGTHDFKAFQAAGTTITDTVRTVYSVSVSDSVNEQILTFNFKGRGFLYRMVRMITGTLIRVGKGVLTLSEVEAALAGSNPLASGPTAPPHGLCLDQVFYDAP
jgi:tRNA pseudouridine38-40 synthase